MGCGGWGRSRVRGRPFDVFLEAKRAEGLGLGPPGVADRSVRVLSPFACACAGGRSPNGAEGRARSAHCVNEKRSKAMCVRLLVRVIFVYF